ncbi:MAG: 30S ribosomal protein S11 [Lentisphaerae bacterium]|nr:30S ribosomal protein S11 [Lentisphaerota bacterium]
MANEKKEVPESAVPQPKAAAAKTAAPKTAAPAAAPAAAAGAPETAASRPEKTARRKAARSVSAGIAHISATFNNTQVAITDLKGAMLAWSSSGRMGFKGTRKSTAYAATVVAQDVARQVSAFRMQEIEVRVQGPGAGRESAIRAMQAAGLTVTLIRDVTPIPHNGCRPRKRRRV